MAFTDTSASDNLFFVIVIGMGLTLWLMPDILRFEASALDFCNSMADNYNSIMAAIGVLTGQIGAFASATIDYGPILIQVAVFVIQIILVLLILATGIVFLVLIKDEMDRRKAKVRPVPGKMSMLHQQQLKEANETFWSSNEKWERGRPKRLKLARKIIRKANREEKKAADAKQAQQKIDDEQARLDKLMEKHRQEREGEADPHLNRSPFAYSTSTAALQVRPFWLTMCCRCISCPTKTWHCKPACGSKLSLGAREKTGKEFLWVAKGPIFCGGPPSRAGLLVH